MLSNSSPTQPVLCLILRGCVDAILCALFLIRGVQDLEYHGSKWSQSLVVREFQSIPLEGELRAFVFEGKLTALSQYYTNCYFPSLQEREESIVESVQRFHQTLSQIVPGALSSYIIDLVVFDDPKQAKHTESGVTLVELNPWSDKTGSALFSWTEDEGTLFGRNPFEFRFLREAPAVRVGASWQSLIDQAKQLEPAQPQNQQNCVVC